MDEPIGLAEMGGDMLRPVEESDAISMDAAFVEGAEDQAAADSCPSQPQVLATLEQWLQNLEGSSARRAR